LKKQTHSKSVKFLPSLRLLWIGNLCRNISIVVMISSN